MLEFFFLALFLGLKHSFDADHIIATSNFFLDSDSLLKSIKMAFSWAIGHMIAAIIITIFLFSFKETFFSLIFEKLELLVAVMLILIGILSIYKSNVFHFHLHAHNGLTHSHFHLHLKKEENNHFHKHIFGVGIIHGLASNDELLLLLTVTLGLSSLFDMVFGVIIFSFGVVLGMIAFSAFFTYNTLKIDSEKLMQIINFGVGSISILYGSFMLTSLIFP